MYEWCLEKLGFISIYHSALPSEKTVILHSVGIEQVIAQYLE